MEELYSDWACNLAPERMCHSIKQIRQEALWTNYTIDGLSE